MRIAIICLVMGGLLASLLTTKLSFLLAWLIVTIIGIIVQVHRINENIAYWTMIGAMIPILWLVVTTL